MGVLLMTNELKSQNKFVDLERLAYGITNQSSHDKGGSSQEIEALRELFDASVGINRDCLTENQSLKKTTARMTHQELIAMKQRSNKVLEPKIQLWQSLLHGLVKLGLTVKGWFSLRDPRRKVCQQIGHQCSHCGMRVSFQHESNEPHHS